MNFPLAFDAGSRSRAIDELAAEVCREAIEFYDIEPGQRFRVAAVKEKAALKAAQVWEETHRIGTLWRVVCRLLQRRRNVGQ